MGFVPVKLCGFLVVCSGDWDVATASGEDEISIDGSFNYVNLAGS